MTTKTIQMYRTNLDGSETALYPLTEAKYVTMDDGTTIEEALTNSDSSKYSPVIESSKAMFKVGEGDSVDLSESAIDGAYNSCVLKGKTMVNCIQEPSSQDVVLPYEFEEGQYVTINDTKESGALGVELKGQTLVNLYELTGTPYQYSSGSAPLRIMSQNLIQGKTYMIILNFSTVNADGKGVINFFPVSVFIDGTSRQESNFNVSSTGVVKIKYTPSKTVEDYALIIGGNNFEGYNPVVIIENAMIIEYVEGMENWDIPYFTGMASCKMPILSTVGKNLFNYKNYNLKVNEGQNPQEIIVDEQGLSFNVDTASWKSLWYDLYLESGEKYTLSYNTNLLRCFIFKSKVNTYVSNELVADTTVTNATEDKIQKVTKTFTAPSTGFIRVRLVSEQKVGNHILQNLQIEKSSSVTTYEPHKSSILSTPSDLELCGIGDVCDTLDLSSGELSQRIGEVVLDGTETDISMRAETLENTLLFRKHLSDVEISSTTIYNDKFDGTPISWNEIITSDKEFIRLYTNDNNALYIRILKSKLKTEDVDGFRNWLTKNPLTIKYQRLNVVNKAVDLKVVDQNGSIIPTLKSWNTTTHIYSEIPENSLYPTLSHSNPTYPVILKPSTKYSIVANSYSNDHTNSAVNFNLGGATASTTVGNRVTTITTPSTLSNELLTMSGRGNKLNNVMVIEGDVAGDEPYFEGICDCKSPILSNVGKNLFDGEIEAGRWLTHGKLEKYNTATTGFRSANIITITPSSRYTISGNFKASGYFVFGNKDGYVTRYIGLPRSSQSMSFNTNPDECYGVWYTVDIEQTEVNKPTNIQLEEASTVTPYEPYKSNILSANGDKIELTEDMFEQGGTIASVGILYENNKESNTARLRLKNILKISPNTTYRLKLKQGYEGYVQTYDKQKLSTSTRLMWNSDILFTTTNNEGYVVITIRNTSNTTIATNVLTDGIITLSEVDKTIVLRSLPNGVCDTLNVETGEYVQKIGEVVFDGSSDEVMWFNTGWTNGECVACYWNVNAMGLPNKKAGAQNMVCDSFPTVTSSIVNTGGIVTREGIWGEAGSSVMYISVNKAKLTELNVTGFRQWASQNPITVQYELATPIVTTVDVQGFPYAYKDGHVQLSSGSIEQSLTPKVEYSLVANRNGQIEANTKSIRRHQDKLDDFEALMLTQMIQTHYEKTLLQFDFEMQMMALGGE